ncbi:queuosine precursor transporter [Kallotenue papyrolyticum]|uniref:queuosine precursor transporter n=1 Tax=Kallotenue papyrolyticum TaxID=1325125 RepID=UPI000472AEE8|nr:queuosine precursor transporter [Kallotenue papyrolyticum]
MADRHAVLHHGDERHSTWFVALVALFVTSLIVSNIAAVKPIQLLGLTMDAGNILFPLSYICGDVLTEVYGYRRARLVIWLGFACNLLAVGAFLLGLHLPAPPEWDGQAAYERILGFTPRLLLASVCGYLLGEFSNAAVLARLKTLTRGRLLWTRTIGSTLVGQGLDSTVFVLIAFVGVLPNALLLTMILSQWLFKVAYEAAATPLTYLVVNALKRREGLDVYDYPPRPLRLGQA